MLPLELFNVWIVDDEIAGTVEGNLEDTYGASGLNLYYTCFEEAGDAAKTASLASSPDNLPDVAVIDLNFNENADHEFLKGDHIDDSELRAIVSGSTAKNQAGFWVGAELVAAAQRTGKLHQIAKLYTAKPDIKEQLGWAAAPSPFSRRPYLSVEFKNQVTPAEIVHDVKEMLWEAGRLRIRSKGSNPRVLLSCLALRDFASSIVSRFQFGELQLARETLLNSCRELAGAVQQAKVSPTKPFPYALLMQAEKPSDVELVFGRDFATASDYATAGCKEQYLRVKRSLDDLRQIEESRRITTADREAFLSLFDETLCNEIATYFPSVSRWLSDRGVNSQQSLLADLGRALQIAAEGDFHWSLCRTFKTILNNGEYNPETTLAQACHFDWGPEGKEDSKRRFPENLLDSELETLALPSSTKDHLRLGDPTAPTDLGPLQSLAWSFSQQRRGFWQQPWNKLNELGNTRVGITIDGSLTDHQHLSDWRLFFMEPDSFIERLKVEFASANVSIDVSPRSPLEIELAIKVTLTEPMNGAPTGGLQRALSLLKGWGKSQWKASIIAESGVRLWTCSNWPAGEPVEMVGADVTEFYFAVTWIVSDYLPGRCLS